MTCFSRIIMHNTDHVITQVDEQGFSNNGPAITQNIKKNRCWDILFSQNYALLKTQRIMKTNSHFLIKTLPMNFLLSLMNVEVPFINRTN